MPSLVPTSVGLSPLVSAALTSAAAAATTTAMSAPPPATEAALGAADAAPSAADAAPSAADKPGAAAAAAAGTDAGGPTYPLNSGLPAEQGIDMTGMCGCLPLLL